MIKKWNLWLALLWIALGILLFAAAVTGVADPVFSGMGGGLLGVGAVQLVRYFRYRKDPEYREKWDTENTDERNRFLSGKAWAWASMLYLILGGIAVIVLPIVGCRDIAFAISYSICALLILYWICYLVLRRTY